MSSYKHLNVLIDTCVMRHAINYKLDKSRFQVCLGEMGIDGLNYSIEDVEAFWKLIEIENITFYYNDLSEYKMEEFSTSELKKIEWFNIQSICVKAAIPLTRADGIAKADGSYLAGGEYGGTLRALLDINHEEKINEAAKQNQHGGDEKKYKKLRYKEHDYEHLESALELGVDYFITMDNKLLRRLESLTPTQKSNAEIAKAKRITIRPSCLLTSIS